MSLVHVPAPATSETRELTVLRYDADFELIADITGESRRWSVARRHG